MCLLNPAVEITSIFTIRLVLILILVRIKEHRVEGGAEESTGREEKALSAPHLVSLPRLAGVRGPRGTLDLVVFVAPASVEDTDLTLFHTHSKFHSSNIQLS